MRKLLFLLIVVLVFSFFFVNRAKNGAKAGVNDNVSGWAWSENIGWISFNSTNQGGGVNYGASVASNGNISGYAWSENIGWISFNETAGCPSSPCQPKMSREIGEVSGWARACAGTVNGDCTGATRSDGWDGWIHLKGSNYGVTVSGCDWQGYAWGSDVVGWIHFKGTNYGVLGEVNACAGGAPSATNLSVSQPDYCVLGSAGFFSWTFQDPGDSQSAYQVQADNNSDFSSPEDDSGKVSSAFQSYATPLGKLSYNTTYFWRLRVWDSYDAESGWISGASFTTPLHAYPEVDFSWVPANPSQDEQAQFTDQSTVFGGSTKSAWSWTFQSGDPSGSSQQNPQAKFTSSGSKTATLQLTDSDGFSCQSSKTVNVQLPFPEWREIAPF